MTISKGSAWGTEVERPADLVVVASDAALVAHLTGPGADRPVAVDGGDLARTIGGSRPGRDVLRRVPIDLLRLRIDGHTTAAVAHVVAARGRRTRGWTGPVLVIANAQYLGRYDIAPRAHPNDGRADVTEIAASMSLRARHQAWRRLPTGTHLPHPDLSTRRVSEATWQFEGPRTVWVDGVRYGRARELALVVEPDAFELHV